MADTFNKLTKMDFIIGMPPITTRTGDPIHTQRSAEALKNMMPVATIYPGIPSFEFGIDLFNRVDTFYDGSHNDPSKKTNKNLTAKDHRTEILNSHRNKIIR